VIAFLKKLVTVLVDALRAFFADGCQQQAAGIAYRLLFSIAPLAIVLVSIFGLVLQNDGVRHDVVNTLVDALPVSASGQKDVEDAITAIATPASAAGLISLLVFAWAATGVMTSLRLGLERAMSVTESRPMARGKLIDVCLIVGAAVLVLITAGLTLLGGFLQRTSGSVASVTHLPASDLAGALLRIATFALSVGVVLLIYRFVPARGLDLRDGLAGAVVTALLLQLISYLSGIIYDRTTRFSVIYGTLTAALVFLYSMYLYTSALLLGAEVATAWSKPPAVGPHEPIESQVKRAVFGLFVKQKPPRPEGKRPAAAGRAPPERDP
jgi:membrane protein